MDLMDVHVQQKPMKVKGTPPIGQVIARCQEGDIGAMETIYLKYKHPIYNLVYRFLGNHAEAEDVLQEIFIKTFRQIQKLRSVDAFKSWIYRIAVNVCISAVRKQNRLNEIPWNDPEGIDGQRTDHRAIALDLDKAIHTLPRKQKMVFILHDLQGFTHLEIAKILKLKTGTCKSQLFKARLKLRNYLKG